MKRTYMSLMMGLAVVMAATAARAQDPYAGAAAYQWGQSETSLRAIEAQVHSASVAQYPAIETKLIAIVQSNAAPEAKEFACRMLRVVGSARCVPAVAKLLADEKCTHMARYALESNPSAAAGEALRAALRQTKGKALAGVIGSIGLRRDSAAVRDLAGLAADADADVAAAAIWSLGEIGTADSAKALAGAKVADGLKPRQAQALIMAANQLKGAEAVAIFRPLMEASQPKPIRLAALKGLIGTLDQAAAVKLIADTLQGEDAAMRAATVAAYSSSDVAMKNAVADRLAQFKPEVQVVLIGVLADQPDVAARKGLLAVVANGQDSVKAAALEALATHGEAADVSALVKLAAGQGDIAAAAKRALDRMGKPRVDEALVNLIPTSDAAGRAVVMAALAARRVESALPALAKYLSGNDAAVAAEAAKALATIGSVNQLPALADVLVSTSAAALRGEAEKAIRQITVRAADKAAAAKTLLAGLAKARNADARVAMIKLLAYTRQSSALAAVRAEMGSATPAVSDAATRTLIDWPEFEAAQYVLNLAKSTSNQTYATLALRSCIRLAQSGGAAMPQRLDLLKNVLSVAKSDADKKQAIAALGSLPTVGALDLLQSYLKNEAMSQDAAMAIARLAPQLAIINNKRAADAIKMAEAAAKTNEVRSALAEANKAVASAGQSRDGSIVAWMLAGPYTEEGKDLSGLFNTAFAPEKTPASVEWRPVAATAGSQLIELNKILGGDNRVAYLRTTINSSRAQPAVLEVGSDDGIKIWLNGRMIHQNDVTRSCAAGSDKVRIRLSAGANTLLMKVTQGSGEWAACARLADQNGKPLEGINTTLEQ